MKHAVLEKLVISSSQCQGGDIPSTKGSGDGWGVSVIFFQLPFLFVPQSLSPKALSSGCLIHRLRDYYQSLRRFSCASLDERPVHTNVLHPAQLEGSALKGGSPPCLAESIRRSASLYV